MASVSSSPARPEWPQGRWPWAAQLLCLALALAGAAAMAVRWGSVPIPSLELWHLITGRPVDPTVRTIVMELRLPRVFLAMAAGSGLAVAGVAWQGVLRNPLADPYLIGVSAGGALGAGLAMAFDLTWPGGASALPAVAFIGSLGAVALVFAVGGMADMRMERLLLAGVAVSALLSALLAVLRTWRTELLPPLDFWIMGSLAPPRGWADLGRAAPYLGAGFAVLLAMAGPLNVLQLGAERARGLGLDPKRVQQVLIGAASLVTAAVVGTCGMIGFVGLVVPHAVRYMVGPDLRKVLPTSLLAGALLLVLADLVARLAGEIPVGVVTAFLGAPFFLVLVMKGPK